MVNQYPHTIIIQPQGEFEQDASGNFNPSAWSGEVFSSECRAEPAGSNPVIKGPVIRGVDGGEIAFGWEVFLPKTDKNFRFGDKVTITVDGNEFPDTLKRQYNGQFNTQLWV